MNTAFVAAAFVGVAMVDASGPLMAVVTAADIADAFAWFVW
jgi:hypothetical protein